MVELLSYRLQDFIPMGAEAYFRLFERLNEDGLSIPLLANLGLLWFVWRGRERSIAALLALCWLWLGWRFHLQLFAELNWAARYSGGAFIAQGLLLMMVALWPGRLWAAVAPFPVVKWGALSLLLMAMVIYPLLSATGPRPWRGIELLGGAPDPTVLTSMALLVFLRPALAWLLLPIPFLWSLYSGAIWYVLAWWPGLLVPVLALISSILLLRSRLDASHASDKLPL